MTQPGTDNTKRLLKGAIISVAIVVFFYAVGHALGEAAAHFMNARDAAN